MKRRDSRVILSLGSLLRILKGTTTISRIAPPDAYNPQKVRRGEISAPFIPCLSNGTVAKHRPGRSVLVEVCSCQPTKRFLKPLGSIGDLSRQHLAARLGRYAPCPEQKRCLLPFPVATPEFFIPATRTGEPAMQGSAVPSHAPLTAGCRQQFLVLPIQKYLGR